MRYLLVIFVLLILGCATPIYYPPGIVGNQVQYYSTIKPLKCSICGEEVYLFKRDNKGRIIGPDCFETKIAHTRKAK